MKGWLPSLLLALVILLPAARASAQIVLSEVMFDPDTLEFYNEFVEIHNNGSAAVDLSGWKIGDDDELDAILPVNGGMTLAPGQFAVILDAGYFGNSTTYDSLIPPDALLLTIDDGSFGQSGWANSLPEPVNLIDAQGDTVQRYIYSLGNLPGFSDEKIRLTAGNELSNWANSLVFRGTPGALNSVTPADRDLALDSLRIFPEHPVEGLPFTLLAVIRNAGEQTVQGFRVDVFEDRNANGRPDSLETFLRDTITAFLNYGDTLRLSRSISGFGAGNHRIGLAAELPDDRKPANNRDTVFVTVEPAGKVLVINEIMFRPKPGFGEWIELYNSGSDNLNLRNWFLADSRDTTLLTAGDFRVPAGGFAVAGGDSSIIWQYGLDPEICLIVKSFPTLNNDWDDLKLLTPGQRLAERVGYTADWMRRKTESGISLERINPYLASQNPDNWAASADPSGSTPGKTNSIFIAEEPATGAISVHPNPFSPDGDGYEDFTFIRYRLALQTGFLSMDVYDLKGRRLKRLAHDMPVGAQGSVIWDGRDADGQIVRIGMYILLTRVFNSDNELVEEYKNIVVVARR